MHRAALVTWISNLIRAFAQQHLKLFSWLSVRCTQRSFGLLSNYIYAPCTILSAAVHACSCAVCAHSLCGAQHTVHTHSYYNATFLTCQRLPLIFFLILVFTRARAFVYNIYNIILYILLLWLKCIHRRKSFILYIYSLPCLRVPTNTHAQHTHANCNSGHCCRKCSRFCEWQRSASPATHTNGNSTSICINFFFLFFLYFALFWELDCEWVGHPCSTHNIPAQTQTHKVATPNNNIRHGIQQSHSSGACRTPNYGHFGILYVFFFFMPTHSRIVVFVYIQYACNMVWYTVFY